MSFASSIFGGSNPTLNQNINKAGQVSSFTNSLGQNLTSQAGGFYSDIMGGDMSKISKLLAPQIGTQVKEGQQAKKTAGEFGTRSGGMSSKGQSIDDSTRANINNMISSLTGSAVTGAAGMGQNLIDTGLKAMSQQTEMSQQQIQNWQDSILGSGITGGISTLESFGLGKIPGMPASA